MSADTQSQLRNALLDSFHRYAEGLDTRNWAMVRSCFADRVFIDYGEISAPTGAPDVPRDADAWLGIVQGVIHAFDKTRHAMSNARFSITPECVNCRVYVSADHVVYSNPMRITGPQDIVTVVGEYSNDYALVGNEWKIVVSRLDVWWTSGNVALLERVAGTGEAPRAP
jgi:hypothetical protein